jgi:hypothetical protein
MSTDLLVWLGQEISGHGKHQESVEEAEKRATEANKHAAEANKREAEAQRQLTEERVRIFLYG